MNERPLWVELESTALMEEYRTLRAEIQQRVTNQLTVAGGNLVLIAAAIQFVLPSFGITARTLVMPILFAAVAWLYFEQDVFIIQAASYLHQKLRPAIIARVSGNQPGGRDPQDVFAWEAFRGALFGKPFYRRFLQFMTAFRLIATAGPGIAILVGVIAIWLRPGIYPQALKRYNNDPVLDVALLALDAAIEVVLVSYAFKIQRMYLTISHGET